MRRDVGGHVQSTARQKPQPLRPAHPLPLCGWSPHKEDHWFCECGHSWNTSDTGAVCPLACTSGLKLSAFRAVDGRRTRIGMRSDLRFGTPLSLVAEINGCSDNERTPCKSHAPQDFMKNPHAQHRAHQRFQVHEDSRLRCWNPLQSPIPQ